MGSGCNSMNINKPLNPISSDEVIYQGEPYAELNICTGDTVTEVEEAIINKILSLTQDGGDITLNGLVLSVCSDIEALVGTDVNLLTVTQALVQYACIQKAQIAALKTQVQGVTTGTIDFKCITAPTTYSIPNALQAIITDHCNLKTQVASLVNASNSTTIISTAITSALTGLITTPGGNGLKKIVSGNNVTYSITGMVPPYSYIPYMGPLTNFDSSGKGLSGTSCEGWYLCNGANGTYDMRGFVPVGAIQGVPGGTLAAIVNPASDATMNYALGVTGGNAKLPLVANNVPAHTHPVNDPGHKHPNVKFYHGPINWGNKNSDHVLTFTSGHSTGTKEAAQADEQTGFTGISVGANTSTATPIDVRQPYRAVYYITRFD